MRKDIIIHVSLLVLLALDLSMLLALETNDVENLLYVWYVLLGSTVIYAVFFLSHLKKK